ncbi:DeoR/GlpR family DNA-binding transcription regulator [Agromyces sp. NPDC004153]
MYATERHQQIADTLELVGRVSVAGLARDFGVTTETIRRDLDALEEAGRLRRVHGGAVPAEQSALAETSLVERLGRNARQKDAIARAALHLVPPTFRGSVLIDSGSTTGRLAELLENWSPDVSGATLDVSTNSVPLAARLHAAANPHLQLRSLGGSVRGITGAAVGPTTIAQLSDIRPDLAFVGANGVSSAFGFSTPDETEAAAKAAMVHAARRVVVLADSTKLDAESLVRFACLDEVDTLITDAAPPPELAEALADADVQVVLA